MKRKYIEPFFSKMYIRNDVYMDKDIKYLRQLSRSKNWENRSRVAELLSSCQQDFAEEILYEMTFDKDELVRADAVDSLGVGKTEKSFERLWHLAQYDRSELVQFHAVLSCGEVYGNLDVLPCGQTQFIEKLHNLICREESSHIHLSCYEVLCYLGEFPAAEGIISILDDAAGKENGTLIWHALHSLSNIDEEILEKHAGKLRAIKPLLNKAQMQYFEEAIL